MSDTNSQATLDTNTPELRLNRLEAAWRGGDSTPDWRQHLPAEEESCNPQLIFDLLQMDIEYRIKAGLPALLSERYFEHPRLQHKEARLDDGQQVELIQWEYLQRLNHGQRPRRAEYEAAFPRHIEALREMKPRSRCPRCHKTLVLEETLQTLLCPDCGVESHLLAAAPRSVGGTTLPAELDVRSYQLIETLGRGGMGEVYRCCDPALGRDLAIKVMKAEYRGLAEAERRFLREARVTGSLQHPSIVPVHNLGRLADGRLHYTMRLVRGETFAAILEKEAGKPERLPYLLSIFEKICQAVAYAHSKRVIHRDLKPHNVMVGRFGEVQVMDWGLAKVLIPEEIAAQSEEMMDAAGTRIPTEIDTPVDLTRQGSGLGTPAYMPPEQALGEWDTVDERADVFALGSILCAILTGEPAYSGTDGNEVYRRAKRGDVAEALQRLQQCEADAALIALCRECLAPEREARPRDADAVAKRVAEYQAEVQERLRRAEVERVEAQLRVREARKQRRLLIAVVLALVAGGALTTWQAVRATYAEKKALAERDDKEIALGKAEAAAEAERQAKDEEALQRKQAQESQADTQAVLTFFQDKVLSAGRPEGQEGGLGNKVTLRKALDAAKPEIAKSFADRPLVEAAIRHTLGETYYYLGDHLQAIQQLERSLTLRETKLGSDHPDTLTSRNSLGIAYGVTGRTTDAIHLLKQTLQQREAILGPDHPDTLISRNCLAAAYSEAGRTTDAIRLHEHNLKQSESKLGLDHADTLFSRNNLATAYKLAGRTAEAIRLFETNLKLIESKRGLDHPDTLVSRQNLANAYQSAGRTTDAIRLLKQTLKLIESKLGPDHPNTLYSMASLGTAYRGNGQLKDAILLLEEALQRGHKRSGGFPAQIAWVPGTLAEIYDQAGHFAKAEAIYRDLLEQARKQFGAEDSRTARQMGMVGFNLLSQHKYVDAEPFLRDCLKIFEAKLPDVWTTFNGRSLLGAALLGQKKYAEAEPLLLQGYEGMKAREAKIPLTGKVYLTEALERLVQLYEAMNNKDEAAKWRRQLEERIAAQKKPKP